MIVKTPDGLLEVRIGDSFYMKDSEEVVKLEIIKEDGSVRYVDELRRIRQPGFVDYSRPAEWLRVQIEKKERAEYERLKEKYEKEGGE